MLIHCIYLGLCGLGGATGHFLLKNVVGQTNGEIRSTWSQTWISKMALLIICFGFVAYKCYDDVTMTFSEAGLAGYAAFSLAELMRKKEKDIAATDK